MMQSTLHMEKTEKRQLALSLFEESVLKPDSDLRRAAHDQECYYELMEWRDEMLNYLNKRRAEEFNQ